MKCTHYNIKNSEQCEQCNHVFCDSCMNDICDWCNHMRSEQTMCPECDATIELFDQTLCIGCVYFGITDNKTIIFCETCDDFIVSDDNECIEKKHEIIKDKKIIVTKMMICYPEAKHFFNLFYGEI